MIKQAAFIYIIFTFITAGLRAQDTAFYYRATVVDSVSGSPLRNVKVTLVETLRGTYTNKSGDFTLSVRKVRSVIRFSSPGYHTTYTATPLLIKSNSIIRLKKNDSDTNTPATSWEKVFRDGKWTLIDFELEDNLIFALARQESSEDFYLLVLDEKGEEKKAVRLREPFVCFHRDYKKNLYLVCKEQVYPLRAGSFSVVDINDAIEVKDFEKRIYPWIAEDSTNIYQRLSSGYEHFINAKLDVLIRQASVSYHATTKKEKRKLLVKNIGYEKYNAPPGVWKKRAELSDVRLPFANMNNVVYDPLPLQLIQTGNSIAFFDLDAKRAETYDSTGRLMLSVNFMSDKDPYYTSRMLTNDQSRLFYCVLKNEKNNDSSSVITLVRELNPKNGSLKHGIVLDSDAYSSVKIAKGYLYYLKRENAKSDRFFLARTKLRE